ncbi:MAG: MFS transporter, partial [Victivallales bacterium]|nr:MFS transporter [Victivallales bacterium]
MKKNIHFLLIAGTLLYFFVNFHRTAIPGAIFDELQSGLALPDAGYIAAIGAAFMYVYSFGQLLSGLVTDRYGGFRAIFVGGALFAIGCAGTPFSTNLLVMVVLRVLTGLGASFMYICMIQVLSQYCQKNFTVVFGFMMCFGYAGSIVAGSPFVACVNAFGWRMTLAIIGFAILTIWVLFAVIYKTVPKEPVKPVPFNIKPFLKVFQRGQNIRFGLYHCINWGLFYTFMTVIGKKFLEDYCRMSAMAASTVITVMATLSAASNLGSGIFSRLAGNRRKPFLAGGAVLSLLCNVLIFTALFCGFRHWSLVILLLLFTLTANMSPVQVAWVKEVNPPDQGGVSLAT